MDEERLSKLKRLQESKTDPYPYSYNYSRYSEDIRSNYDTLEGQVESVAGRIMQKRDFGKLAFATIQDNRGKIQIVATADSLSDSIEDFKRLDLGDIIGVKGKVGKTKKGEVSIIATEFSILSKSLRALPDKFKGLTDTEIRYRKRYLDLLANPQVRRFFESRTKIIDSIRQFLNTRGYLEVDTPILQKVYGGAAAKPFITMHHALDERLYLRISNELYLKRLIIGGIDKVYEFSKDFRNEDIDSTHNPEFTQVEFYEAYKDYNDYMKMTQELFSFVLEQLGIKDKKITFQGQEIDFSKFETVSLYEKIKEKSGIDILEWSNEDQAYSQCVDKGVKPSKKTLAKCMDALFDHYVVPDLANPTFVIDFPYYVCPLTKKKRGEPRLAERFELFIAGFECGNCYSELTNPLEQRKKLEEQAAALRAGDEESTPIDEDFLEAMEYGMPPTAGMGIGIDRLAMILTDNISIKEVILFPSVRDKE